MADEAAIVAEEAASIAEVAADEAAFMVDEIADEADMSGVVTMVVVDGVVDIVEGGVIVVVVSSFLLQAANETAAASVTINRAVFIFLLGGFKGSNKDRQFRDPSVEEPPHQKTRNAEASIA